MNEFKRKPLRAARAQVSAPETTVRALYSSAIGIDVHLNLLVCCFQKQYDGHKELQESRDFYTDRQSLNEFVAWCTEKNPEIILMESTGILWLSPYEALENAGFDDSRLAVINARDAKAAVGRKTDRKDAGRLAQLARSGHFRKSFVPPADFRQQRFTAREYIQIRSDISRLSNRYQKLLNTTGCRASTVFSNVRGKAAAIILEAKLNGTKNLREIVERNCSRLNSSAEEILSALDFQITPSSRTLLQSMKRHLEDMEKWAEETFDQLRQLQQPYEEHFQLLMSIPGVQERSARLILAELCEDLGRRFPDSEHFASWLGICPGDNTSAGRQKSGKCPKGNKWLRRTLVECVRGFTRSRNSPSQDKFMAMKARRGFRRATVAMAHFPARIIYSVLTKKKSFVIRVSSAYRGVLMKRLHRTAKEAARLPDSEIAVINGLVVEKNTGVILAELSHAS